MPSRDPLWVAGVVVDSRAQMTRRGMMRVVELDDGSGRMEVTVFNELYESCRSVLKVDEPLIVSAKVDHDEYSGSLRGSAVDILTLAEARLRYAKGVRLTIEAKSAAGVQALVARLQAGLIPLDSDAPAEQPKPKLQDPSSMRLQVFLSLILPAQECEVRLGNEWWVAADNSSLDWLRNRLNDLVPDCIKKVSDPLEILYGA
jgi:DNA polymerase III alpha subunit